jgi:hypothetical protein
MIIPLQIFSLALVAFFLVFAAEARYCTLFSEDRAATSSEHDRGLSPDEFTARVFAQTRSGINRHVKFVNLYLDKRIFGPVASPAPVLKLSAVRETYPSVALIALSTTVLRI